MYEVFNNEEYKRKIIGYDSKHQLYEIEYEDGDKEAFYDNEIYACQNTTTDPQVKSYIPLSSTNLNKSSKSNLPSLLLSNKSSKLKILSSMLKSNKLTSTSNLSSSLIKLKTRHPVCHPTRHLVHQNVFHHPIQ